MAVFCAWGWGPARRNFDVRRLQVAMDDAFLVRGFERVANLTRDRKGFVKWKALGGCNQKYESVYAAF